MGEKLDILTALKNTTLKIKEWTEEKLDNKVNRDGNKGLSTNDYTNVDKNKVSSIPNDLLVMDGKLYLAQDGVKIEDSAVTLPSGGGGGTGSSAVITLRNELESNILTVAVDGKSELKFSFSSSEDEGGNGTAYIYIGGVLKTTFPIVSGENTIDIKDYIGEGANEVKLTCMDIYSNSKSLSYTVNAINLRITSNFDDSQQYSGDITIPYIPYGAVSKDVHFCIDDSTTITNTISTTGVKQTQVLPAMYHGAHKLKIYATAIIGGVEVKSNELLFDIMCVEENATTPMISSAYSVTSLTQGELANIPFSVFDPVNMNTEITLTIKQGNEIYSTSTRTVDRTRQTWSTRDFPVGEVTFIIAYGNITKMHTVTVVENDINVSIKNTNLEFNLSAAGRSNEDNDKDVWSDKDVTTTFEYLNWEGTGWVNDENGDTALRLSGDAKATINFMPFKTDARQSGRTIEMEFAIRDVNNRDAVAISCLNDGIGFAVTADTATIKSEQSEIFCKYTTEKKILVTFVIESRADNRLISVYLNGVLSDIDQYVENDNLQQTTPVNITIGSPYCSVDLYSIRSYNVALTKEEVRDNYIASITDVSEQLAVYEDNDVYDDFGFLSFSKMQSKLPSLMIIGDLPTYKGDKKKVTIVYNDPDNPSLNFEASATIDVQGTSSQWYVVKNFKTKTSSAYQIASDQIETRVLCFKADYAEATSTHNTGTANFVHTLYDTKVPPQEEDERVRTTIYGHPSVIFHKKDSSSDPVFVGKYNTNHDKGSEETFGFTSDYPDVQSVEFCNNTSEACLFQGPIPSDWSDDFEFRYPDGHSDISAFKEMHDWVVSTYQIDATGDALEETYIGVDGDQHTHDTAEYRLAKFKKEFEEHFDMEYALVYYIYTFFALMVDQRAKNLFLTSWDKKHWLCYFYDNDTIYGINNQGDLVLDYYYEDRDQLGDAYVFNGATSTLWVNFKAAFQDEIKEKYRELRSTNKLTKPKLTEAYVTNQAEKWSISIYNEDSDFKYVSMVRSKNDTSNLNQVRGTGVEHLDYMLDNRFVYCDSMWYAGNEVDYNYPEDYISLRIYTPVDENDNPRTDLVVAPNADITVTPYSSMYAGVKYKANGTLLQERATANIPVTFTPPRNSDTGEAEKFNNTETAVFGASQISSLGDLSALYCGSIKVAKATKLTELIVGSGLEGYKNENLWELEVGTNKLLKKVDVRNCPKLTTPLALSNCPNIQEIYATGSGITGVELPPSGYLKKVYLPGTLTNLTVTNQQYIEEFELEGYSNLTTLRIENTVNIPVEDIMLNAQNLNRIRLIDVIWNAESEAALVQTIDKFKSCLGLDANGNNTNNAVVTGRVYVAEKVSDAVIGDIYDNFPNLIVDDGSEELYIVNYKDWDGTILYSDRLAEGVDAIDPIQAGKINAPSRESDENYSYEFIGWNMIPTNVSRHYIVTAQYNTKVAINFAVDGKIIHSDYVIYGTHAEDPVVNGTIDPPVKEGTDDLQYAFNGWDGSLLNITLPRTVNALFANVYPVRFYSTPSSPAPHYVQWVKEGEDAHDPSTDEGYTTPPDILDTDIEDKKYVFSAWDNLPTSVTSICKVYATYDSYWAVRFYNEPIDGKGYKEVDIQWIKETYSAVDPITRAENPIEKPTKESTAQYDFTFSVWEGDYTNVTEARKIYAVYNNTTRRYNVYFCNMTQNNVLYTVENVLYGGSANYYGPTPVKMGVDDPENYVFMGWSPIPEKIEGETYCYALFRYNAYLFGKLGEEDQGWGTIEAPNWSAINSYWTQIDSDVDAFENNSITEDEFKKKYPIGGRMLIPVIVDGAEYNADVEIIEYNHDNLADGSGKATLTFMCKNLPGFRKPMYGSSVDNAGWEHSTMREFCNGELFNAFPTELQTIIEPVLKISDGGEVNRALVTTTDKCWLASYPEVGFASISEVLPGQGEVYASTYSTNKNSRVKYLPDGYTPYGWWLRSSSYSLTSDSALFCRVQASGILYGDIETNKYAVVFGFCIGKGSSNAEMDAKQTAILGDGELGTLILGRGE